MIFYCYKVKWEIIGLNIKGEIESGYSEDFSMSQLNELGPCFEFPFACLGEYES